MWALPRRIHENIDTMKVDRLMRGSRYKIATVKAWLHDHDRYDWTAKQQRYRLRGPTARAPELAEELTEFVRIYPPNSGAAAAQDESTLLKYKRIVHIFPFYGRMLNEPITPSKL
jgi:hypothetical protein